MALIKPWSDVVRGVPMSRLEAHARKICFPNVPARGPCTRQKTKTHTFASQDHREYG